MKTSNKYLLVLFFLLLLPSVHALTKPCPGNFGAAVEWLYMLPGIDQPYFVTKFETDDPDLSDPSKRLAADQDWHSGYRLELIYSFCNCFNDVRVRWTHFPSFSNTAHIQGFLVPVFALPFAPNMFATDAKIRNTYEFFYLDVLFGQKAINCGCFTLDLQGGIQYGHLCLKEDVDYIFPSTTTGIPGLTEDRFESHMWGIGPEIGAEFCYALGSCFCLTGRGYTALLISERRVSQFTKNIPEDFDLLNVKDQDYWKVIPTSSLRFGLNFSRLIDSCLCSFNLDLELGYEAIWVFQGIERINNLNDFFSPTQVEGTGGSFNQLITFSIHGPYIHVGVSY